MKNYFALITATLLLGSISAHSETWPEIRKPATASVGVEKNTKYLYMLDGQIYTVWRAPLGSAGGNGGGSGSVLRGRDRALEDEIATRLALGILTQADYEYIREWMLGSPDMYFGALSVPGDWHPDPSHPGSIMDGTSEYYGVPEQLAWGALMAYLEDPSQLPLTGPELMDFLGAVEDYVDADSYATAVLRSLTSDLPPDVASAIHTGIDWQAINWTPGGDQYHMFFDRLNLSDTNITGAIIQNALMAAHQNSSGLAGANVSGLDLTGLDFAGRNLSGLIIGGASGIDWASFALASNITGVDYSDVNLSGLSLSGKIITGSDFSGATNVPLATINTPSLVDVNFSGLDLTSLNLSGKQVQGADFSRATVIGTPTLGARLSMANSNYTGANLSNTTLTGLVYSGKNFSHVNFTNATGLNPAGLKTSAAGGLTGAVLTGTGITRAQLAAPPNARPAAELDSITW